MRQLTLVVCLDFFTASLVYFSVGLGATNFKTDPYIYMASGGIVDAISALMMSILVNRVGRKIPAITCFLVTGVTLIGIYFIPKGMCKLEKCVNLSISVLLIHNLSFTMSVILFPCLTVHLPEYLFLSGWLYP